MAEIYEDTRQQAGKHDIKHEWFAAHGIEVVRRKLDFGDYERDGSNVSVDTKRDVQELAGDVGRDHARFVREIERANQAGYRLVVLVERVGDNGATVRMGEWVSGVCSRCRYRKAHMCKPLETHGCRAHGRKPLMGVPFARMLYTLESKHGVVFRFCRVDQTARTICELLGVTWEDGHVGGGA